MHSLSHSRSFLRPLTSFPSSSHRTSYLTLHSSSSSFISSAIYRAHAPSTAPNKLRGTRLIPSDTYNASHWERQLSPPHPLDLAPSEADTDNGSSKGLLKFLLLFGLLALGDSNPSFAASDALPFFQDFGDLTTGFASAFLLIFFSELGDKTFFIAALLAARNSGVVVFIGTFGALAAMTLISVVLGRTFHYVDEILPFRFGETDLPVDDIAAVCLLLYFGVSTLVDASSSDGQKSDDEQKEAELAVSEFSGNGAGMLAAAGTVVSTFLLVFVAEWGDKSFFSTIALAAASSPLGVIGGALAGHGAATLLAVLGGSLLGTFLSEKVISYIGGVLFLVFAAVTLFEIVQ
ncbi:Protein pam71, chloroplastic [Stylosanthes scabra]|uniref:GDT1 family protein n=1 Tax=Stylosanthes scabra TaxID=79078 RepID=A0ABU6U5K2_9FABA|nr:Protein pam71, chloroplastic [Stylosanthes scabra]